jgi:hypothetical protein
MLSAADTFLSHSIKLGACGTAFVRVTRMFLLVFDSVVADSWKDIICQIPFLVCIQSESADEASTQKVYLCLQAGDHFAMVQRSTLGILLHYTGIFCRPPARSTSNQNW